jgi:hypothetical protein
MELRTRLRIAALAVGLVALLALVALASRAGRGRLSPGSSLPPPPDAFFDYAFTLGAILVGAILLVAFRPGARTWRPRQRSPWYLVRSILPVLLLPLLVFLARELHFTGHRPQPAEVVQSGRRTQPKAGAAAGGHTYRFRWEAAAIFGGLLLVGGVATYAARRRLLGLRPLPRVESLPQELCLALGESLDDLRSERDARRAVIAAYARAERVLAAQNLPRRPSETPMEYLGRVLANLRVQPDAVLELTGLFERAKFSPHEVDEAMRADAIAALVAVRDELRTAA